MASSSLPLKVWCFVIVVLCGATTRCSSGVHAPIVEDPEDIVTRALQCFDDQSVYSGCQESYRLSAKGILNVPPEAADEYCDGPCLDETKLVLSCVNDILYNFRFYNGASLRDVKYTLNSGCGHTNKRGDFNVLGHLGGYGDEYGEYDHANRPENLTLLMIFLVSCALLIWAY